MSSIRNLVAALCCVPLLALATRLTPEQITEACADADGPAQCGRLIEAMQLKRLPGLAQRNGNVLTVTLYPSGSATFTDVDAGDNARSYSLWDALDPINAVLLYTTTDEATTFTLLLRRSNRRFTLPSEPALSPDRQRLATADFCPTRCTNEIAIWRVSGDNLRKELAWRPAIGDWIDAGIRWEDADTLAIDYTSAGTGEAKVERRLGDPTWTRLPPP